jgi:hypothetical protein
MSINANRFVGQVRKDKGVSAKVGSDFYRMMERVRLNLRNQHGIKISSDIKLTNMWARNPQMFINKKLIGQIKRCKL